MAEQGRSALSILRYYYGNDVEVIRTSNIASIPESYPGSPVRRGDRGPSVFTLQRQLNRITKDYPFFGTLTPDGIFGEQMAETVKRFQRQFSLTADGVVGRQTWYKISYIYVSVKDLAELTSEGETSSGVLSDGTWGGTVLRTGSRGGAVEQLQFWLNTISQYVASIPSVSVERQLRQQDGGGGPRLPAPVRPRRGRRGGRSHLERHLRPVLQHPVGQRHPQRLPRHGAAPGRRGAERPPDPVLAQDRPHRLHCPEQPHRGRPLRRGYDPGGPGVPAVFRG